MNRVDVVVLASLFVLAFLLWTLPLHTMPLGNDARPFGEGDSAWHFSIGDYIAQSDTPISRLPFYIGQWYYNYNEVLGPNALEYPPPNHYNYALMQVVGGERFSSVLIYRAVASFLGVFATYFLVRRLFGLPAAAVAATALVFSVREQQIYLWGQQPTLIAVVILPVTLYAFYRYLTSYYEGESQVRYLYVTAALLLSQFLLHIQGFIITAVVLGLFTLFMVLRSRALPWKDYRHAIFAAAAFLLISAPFLLIYFGAADQTSTPGEVSRLFRWSFTGEEVLGNYSPQFVTFTDEYKILQPSFLGSFPYLPLALLFVGLGFVMVRRKPQDLLLLSWLVAVYFTLHIDVFLQAGVGRAARMGVAEPPLFFTLMGLGAVYLVSLVPLKKPSRLYARYGVAALLIVVILVNGIGNTQTSLSNAYTSIFRMTDPQYESALWLRENTEEGALVLYVAGGDEFKIAQWQYPKARWMLAASQRYVTFYPSELVRNEDNRDSPVYLMFDYSDLLIVASQPNPWQQIAQQNGARMVQFEQNFSSPLYESDTVHIYRAPEGFYED